MSHIINAVTDRHPQEPVENHSYLHRFHSINAALLGVVFFFAIIGVFGLRWAITALSVFVLGAVVVCFALPTEDVES
jgi:hypothetical protein